MQTLEFFHASSKDGLYMLVASETEQDALETARKALDRWDLAVLPASQEQVQQFNNILAQSVSIH